MGRTVETRVDPVSTAPSVTMPTVSVYRGVVQGSRGTNVQKVVYIYDGYYIYTNDTSRLFQFFRF